MSALAQELKAGEWVLLEGPMGAGKSTFARLLLDALGVEQSAEGSPTFAIAHEYRSRKGEIVHMDLYRIKSPFELEEAGIYAYFWERDALVLAEWVSLWSELEQSLLENPRRTVWRVSLAFSEGSDQGRDVRIEKQGA